MVSVKFYSLRFDGSVKNRNCFLQGIVSAKWIYFQHFPNFPAASYKDRDHAVSLPLQEKRKQRQRPMDNQCCLNTKSHLKHEW